MTTLTVTSKGQVTLRKDILLHLGVIPGDQISIEKLADGRIEVKAAPASGLISDVFGMLKPSTSVHLTIEEMNDIAASGWAGKR
jgi:bifunctional DNA-binding transcriptional regulator/antitoxin component of YhaV-PrlF toxin-antitoxin module